MRLNNAVRPNLFLSSEGTVLYPKISKTIKNLLGTTNIDDYFFVLDREELGENIPSKIAYIADAPTIIDILETDITSIIEENKYSIIDSQYSLSRDPVEIDMEKYGVSSILPENVRIKIKVRNKPSITKDLMKIHLVKESPNIFAELLDSKNIRKGKLYLLKSELWEKEIEEDWRGELTGPYKLIQEKKPRKKLYNIDYFYSEIFDENKLNCWFMKDIKYSQSILAGFEDDTDLMMRIYRFKPFK
jgi:hypothetical protein